MRVRSQLVSLSLLALGLAIFGVIGGLKLAAVFLMLWIDRVIIGKLKVPLEFGIELYSLPAIIVGVVYGPSMGFFFGFLIIPIIGGILDITISLLSGSHLMDTGWEPLIPSMESIISGMIAVVGGFLGPLMPFLYVVMICIGVRFIINVLKDVVMQQPPKIISYLINFGLNVGIAFFLQGVFIFLLA